MIKRAKKAKFVENPQSFAAGINFYKIVWIFFIGCIVGHIAEMLFAYAKNGEWINRQGLIYGPFNQIYGMGMVLCALVLYRWRNMNALFIFVISAVLGSVFEYACSWAQEFVFGSVSWEYSDTPANLHGRTNLFFAFCWGILGLVFIRNFYPYMCKWVEKIPDKMGKPLTILITIFMSFDIIISAAAVARQSERIKDAEPSNFIESFLDSCYPDEFLENIYPSMKFK